MSQLNNLTVYLSKSLLTPESKLRPIREYLLGLGLKVTEYIEGTTYSEKNLKEADFVLFVPFYPSVLEGHSYVGNTYSTYAGRGQFTEAELVRKLKKPSFMFHSLNVGYDGLRISKLSGDEHHNISHDIYDSNDWKKKYGNIISYTKGNLTADFEMFITGMFYSKIHDVKLPYSGEISFMNSNLLLLL